MRDPQQQKAATRKHGRTPEIEGREAQHLRQRRRQRSSARVSDLAVCEPLKRPRPYKPTSHNRPCILTAKHTA